MLLLAAAALPGRVEAASVDHQLRKEGAYEARMVGEVCADLGVPHAVLTVEVGAGNVQSEARRARYAALVGWMSQGAGKGDALATAHHADDQAETLLMRLNRASGLSGLSGIRARTLVPGTALTLLRPLLGWRRAELAKVVEDAGLVPADDPSNRNSDFDRVRMRQNLANADWINAERLTASAANLADAEAALEAWIDELWAGAEKSDGEVSFEPPPHRYLQIAMAKRAIAHFGGTARGGQIAALVDGHAESLNANLGGVMVRLGALRWHFAPEPPRGH